MKDTIAIIKSDVHVCSALIKAIKEACENCTYVRVDFVAKHKKNRLRLAYSLQKSIGHLYNVHIDDTCCLISKRQVKQRYKLN